MRFVHVNCLIILAAALPGNAAAQEKYRSKPVRLILPFPPGGGSDTFSRIFGPKLAEALGQTVVIDNRLDKWKKVVQSVGMRLD